MQKAHVRIILFILIVGFISGCVEREGQKAIVRPAPKFNAGEILMIDAHSQVPHRYEELDEIIRLMDLGGIARTILSSRGPVKPQQLVTFASRYPKRIIPAVRTKNRYYRENDERFYAYLSAASTLLSSG